MKQEVKEKHRRKLLVEGNDDRHVIWALCEKHHVPEHFDVIDCCGIDNLEKRISVTFKMPGVETVGIIVDADTNLRSRWETLKNILTTVGFKMPDTLPESGLILTNGIQKTGIWIMPNNNSTGMLEDFISFLIPDGDLLLPVVDSTLQTIESRNLNKYSIGHKSKATIHTWLAWQEDPGVPMGASITRKYLSADEITCRKFIHWLNELFE
jgi:hypothetical protein